MDSDIMLLINYLNEHKDEPEVLERFRQAVISEIFREDQECDCERPETDCKTQ